MKWKNVDIGPAYYYITGTFTQWLPLFDRPDVRELVSTEIIRALAECNATIAAFVIMPDHIHLLVWLPKGGLLHKFNKLWRGRSGRKIPKLLSTQADAEIIAILQSHANGGCRYAVWKEQARALPIWEPAKLSAKINYTHRNPLRRGLVINPEDWPFSSFRFYETGESGLLPVTPPVL